MDQHSIILVLTLIIVILAIYLVVKHSGGEQFRRTCIEGTYNWNKEMCQKYAGSSWNGKCCDINFD